MSSNLPSIISYESIFSEFLCITRCTLRINDLVPRASDLFSRMTTQSWNWATLQKAFQSYPTAFQKIRKTKKKINNSGPVHGIQNENLRHVLPFHDCALFYEYNQCVYRCNKWSKLDETILSSELEVNGYIKSLIACNHKDSLCSNIKSIFVDIYLPKLPIFVTKTCFHRDWDFG